MTHSIGFVVANITCQFAAAVLLASLLLRALRRPSAPVRHVVWLAVMLSPALFAVLSTAPPRVTLFEGGASQQAAPAAPVPEPRAMEPAPSALPASSGAPVAVSRATELPPDAQVAPAGVAMTAPSPTVDAPIHATASPSSAPASAADTTPRASLATWAFRTCLAGVVAFTLWTAMGFVRVRRIASRAETVADDDIDAVVTLLSAAIGVRRPVRVLVSDMVATPFCARVLSPVIVLPRTLLAHPARVRMVIAHELAHIRRRDHIWTALGSVVGVFCYCHPGFYIARRGYRLASEETCDAIAVRVTGSARDYVACLAEIARVSLGSYPLGFAEPRGSLARRVHRVLYGEGGVTMLRRRSLYMAGTAVAILILALSGVRLVADAPDPAAPAAAQDATDREATTEERWATRFRNLDAIHAALMAYREENGDYPTWLSDLHPRHLANASYLIDPFDPSSGHPDERETGVATDPNLPVSYRYELNPRRRDFMSGQIEEHGAHAPIVRAGYQRGLGTLNLGVGGRFYLSPGVWQALKVALDEEELLRDGGRLIFAMELRDLPEGYAMPERITRDVDAIVAAFASQAGDSAGRYHAEAILRAWNHDRDGAVRVMREALDRDPADTQILYHYARLLHQMGRHDEAMPLYERIIASDRHEMRQWEETHRHLSELYAEAREDAKHRALIAGFEGYVADGARHLQGDLLRMYVRAGMFDRVVEQGPEFLKVNANDTGVAGLIAEAHRELGNDDEAERYHRLANPAYALVGRKAPAFTLKDAEGGERSLQMLAGKPILLSLWWSGGVPGHVSHMAAVEKLHGEYAGDGLVVLGGCVSTGIGGRTRELGLVDGVATFPILFDGRTAYQAYGIEAAATVLIDDQGYVRHVTTDPGKEAEALRTAVTTVLASADGAAASSARIAGFARDEDGAPVPGATITVYVRDTFESRLREIDQTRSGVDGAFALEARPALAEEAMQNGARYQVVGIAEGRSLGLANVNSVFDELEAVELLFTTPADLTGTLADESGQPVEDAQVFIRSAVERGPGGKPTPGSHRLLFFTGRGYGPLSATTAADGSFTIRALPTGVGGLVSVRHADYAHVHESYDLSSGAPLRASVPRAGVLTGRVYYAGMLAGRPPEEGVAPDIEVRVQTAMPAALDRQIHGSGGGAVPYPRHFGIGVKTDAEGRYRIEGIPGGYLNIWAEAEGYTCVAWDTFQITAGQIHTADLFLIEGGFIVGRVLDDETGRPLRPGERSDVGLHGPSRPMSGDAVDHARIAEDGTYRLRAAPGVNFPYLRARPPWTTVGPPDQRWAHLVNVEDGKTVEVEFRVRRADAATAN